MPGFEGPLCGSPNSRRFDRAGNGQHRVARSIISRMVLLELPERQPLNGRAGTDCRVSERVARKKQRSNQIVRVDLTTRFVQITQSFFEDDAPFDFKTLKQGAAQH